MASLARVSVTLLQRTDRRGTRRPARAAAASAARVSALVLLTGALITGAVLLLGPARLVEVTLDAAHALTKTALMPQ